MRIPVTRTTEEMTDKPHRALSVAIDVIIKVILRVPDPSCPAKDKKCTNCGLVGHFVKVCKTKQKARPGQLSIKHIENEDEEFTFSLNSEAVINTACVNVTCKVGGIETMFLIDSGSNINVVNRSTWEFLKQRKIKCRNWRPSEKMKVYGGHSVTVIGRFVATIENKDKVFETEFVVHDGNSPSLLSRETSTKLGLISFHVNAVVDAKKPTSGFKAHIPVDADCTLPFCKARPVRFGLQKDVEKRLQEMEDEGIIKKVESSSNATPIVEVQKRTGGVRICGDYKVSLNKFVKQVPVKNSNVNDMFVKLGNNRVYSHIDLEHEYLQLKLDEKSKDLTTINTQLGLFRYERLPYGISASPGIFESVLVKILDCLPGVISYMDDILVMGKDTK